MTLAINKTVAQHLSDIRDRVEKTGAVLLEEPAVFETEDGMFGRAKAYKLNDSGNITVITYHLSDLCIWQSTDVISLTPSNIEELARISNG